MRALGIDFGERRIGLALSDPEGRYALPLEVFERKNDRSAIHHVAALIESEGVELLVIGEPLRLDGSRGPAAERCARFAEKLSAVTGLPHRLIDESLTSVEAERRLRQGRKRRKGDTARVDALAAQILLQEALDSQDSQQETSGD